MKPSRLAALFALVVNCAIAQDKTKDPFEDLTPAAAEKAAIQSSWLRHFFTDNFAFKKELMSEVDTNERGEGASRQSAGLELYKKFSTATATVASFDFQCRLIRRDGYNPIPNDMDGASHEGWSFEFDNLYVDLYNVLNPVLSEPSRAANVGRYNFRLGHFYVPFGINLQTDTHGTLLQLSNGDDFGFDQDWYAGFWGALNRHLNYDVYYLAGSGTNPRFRGQTGLGAMRLSLANQYSSEYGWEGGVSLISGQRLSDNVRIQTERIGIDGRYRHTAPHGLLTFTAEFSGGQDALPAQSSRLATTQLAQTEYLHSSRRWGIASQFRRSESDETGTASAVIGEFTWYLRNDVANTNFHWLKLNIERQLQVTTGAPHTIVTLQYYFYL